MFNLKGKYFLDQVDDREYSTNDYPVYYWYNKIFFDFDVHVDTYNHNPKKNLDPPIPVTNDTLRDVLKREISYYENGYVYKSKFYKIRGEQVKKGKWVKDSVKAKLIFESIKEKHKDFFPYIQLEGFF